jgi:hypothetical protein
MPRPSFLLALLCVPLIVGCEGCSSDTDQADSGQPQETPLQDFTPRPSLAFPADANPQAGGVKPGHWMTAAQSLRSNKNDARGELITQASVAKQSIPTAINAGQAYGRKSVRPIVLPKGQMRRFDSRLLTPVPASIELRRMSLGSRFVSAGRGMFFDTGRQPFNLMVGEEYFFVILTTRPQRFARLQVADWVRPYRPPEEFQDRSSNYRIVFPPTNDVLPLPETMLDWTNTAVVLWDDLEANALTPQQETALADWVRFGGQLIVNGALASDAIAKTRLADVLPLRPSGNIELDPDATAELLIGCSVARDPSTEKQIAMVRSQAGRVSIDGTLAPGAAAIDETGKLVLQRRVGRGRVVQPRFDLTSDWMLSWESYNSFINSVILLRPRREYIDTGDSELASFKQRFVDYPDLKADAAINTGLRLTARDAILKTNEEGSGGSQKISSLVDPLTFVDAVTGIGGWTDASDTIGICRGILKDESGIEIPDSSLVVKSLSWYLLILVPINYLIFRLLGRLEYAWLAVPVIAIGGAIWVAREARLDIGFARSQMELAVLEMPANYPRGHLTRIVAIYNSLSSRYDVSFKTIDGAAAPIEDQAVAADDDASVFRTSFAEGPCLSGLAVGSNKVKLIHAEQIIDIGGGIVRQGDDLLNSTQHELLDAYVIEHDQQGSTRVAVVGLCPAGSATTLRFRQSPSINVPDELPMQTAQLISRLAAPAAMAKGTARLVARIDGSLDGMTISPSANQQQAQTIVVAHLQYQPLPRPRPDTNLISQFRKSQRAAVDALLQDGQADDNEKDAL